MLESVEDTLNGLLDAEADALCGAARYAPARSGWTRGPGITNGKLHTKAGEVSLKVPKLRSLPFETRILERYRRRESSVEEALMEMVLGRGWACAGSRTSPRRCGECVRARLRSAT